MYFFFWYDRNWDCCFHEYLNMPPGCIGLFFPCFLFGKNAEFLGSGTLVGSCITHFILWAFVNTLCCVLSQGCLLALPGCFVSCYACGYRKTLRSRYNLQVFYAFIQFRFYHICFLFPLLYFLFEQVYFELFFRLVWDYDLVSFIRMQALLMWCLEILMIEA